MERLDQAPFETGGALAGGAVLPAQAPAGRDTSAASVAAYALSQKMPVDPLSFAMDRRTELPIPTSIPWSPFFTARTSSTTAFAASSIPLPPKLVTTPFLTSISAHFAG